MPALLAAGFGVPVSAPTNPSLIWNQSQLVVFSEFSKEIRDPWAPEGSAGWAALDSATAVTKQFASEKERR